ncbi:MAG: hypothetical protein VB093_18570 [Propionicimonas sp.]|nr:hypothetical protein [Propionicimonas sp.]
MNDIDELLQQTGDTWRTRGVPALDLDAALARGRRRLRATTTVFAAVAVLVGAGVVWQVWPSGGLPAVPSPTTATLAPLQSPTPAPTRTPSASDELVQLTRIARDNATSLGRGQQPVTAEAVLTTRGRAEAALDSQSQPSEAGQAVWLLQLRGLFVCDSCSRPAGAEAPVGSAVQLVLDATSFEGSTFGLTREAVDLVSLGTVVALDLGDLLLEPLPTPDPETTALADTVRQLLQQVTHDDDALLSGSAVPTTLGAAQRALFGHTPYPASDTAVWFVELQGTFSCRDCTLREDVSKATGNVLTLVIDQVTGEPLLRTISNQRVDLLNLDGAEARQLTPQDLSTGPDRQPTFARYPRSTPLGEGDAAALDGRLLRLGRCLVVEADDGSVVVPVLPHPDASWSSLDHTLTIGTTVLRPGDRVSWGGAVLDTLPADATVPDQCHGLGGEYFLVHMV